MILINYRKLYKVLLLCFFCHSAYSQLGKKHYIPPLHESLQFTVRETNIYLSTPNPIPFDVTVKDALGNVLGIRTISQGNSDSILIPLNLLILTFAELHQPLNNRGVILEASSEFFASLRVYSLPHAGYLTAKGELAAGSIFRIGHSPLPDPGQFRYNFTVGIMALEDNTTVEISEYDSAVIFQSSTGDVTDDQLSFNLDSKETVVVTGYHLHPFNSSGLIGALVKSTNPNKPIVVSAGNIIGSTINNPIGADIFIDQLVPSNIIGNNPTEYIFIKGNGTDDYERPIIIASQDNTEVRLNGQTTPIAILNAGDHYRFTGSDYTGTGHENMYVHTSKPTYAYQFLAGSTDDWTGGMNFVPPLSCFFQRSVDLIPNIREIFPGQLNLEGSIIVISKTGSNVQINASPIGSPSESVQGTTDWETYKVDFNDISDIHAAITSDGPMAAGILGLFGDAGFGGYYSGFGVYPVDSQAEICFGDDQVDLFEIISGNPPSGGVWSPALSGGAGIFVPGTDTAGVYNYSVNSECGPISVDVTVIQDSCSTTCSLIDTGKTLESYNDNGTPTDGTDDFITFSLNPTGTNLGTTYNVSVDNGGSITPTSGTYGSPTAFQLQNGSADGTTTYSITITDAAGASCTITTTVFQNSRLIEPCSNILFILDDSGSISATERADMTVSVQALADAIEIANPAVQIGVVQYGSNVPITINYAIETGFISNPTIVNTKIVGLWNDYLPTSIDHMQVDGLFTGTGIFAQTSDIFIFTDATFGVGGSWINGTGIPSPAFLTPLPGWGEYQQLAVMLGGANISMYRVGVDGGSVTGLEQNGGILSEGNPDFNMSIAQIASFIASFDCPMCTLTDAGETLESCNNNGTTNDPSDDYITFSLNPTGTSLGATYNVSVDNGGFITPTSGTYGSPTAFQLQNGSADGTTYTITITDTANASCFVTTTVSLNHCSIEPCSNVLFILDDSGSISATERADMTVSVQALADAIEVVNPAVQIGVVQYGVGIYTDPTYIIETGFMTNPTIINADTYLFQDYLPISIDQMQRDGLFTGTGIFAQTSDVFIFTDASYGYPGSHLNGTGMTIPIPGVNPLPEWEEYEQLAAMLGGANISMYRVDVDGGSVTGLEQNGGILSEGNLDFNMSSVQIAAYLASFECPSCGLNVNKTNETCNNNGTPTDGTDDYITFSLNPTGYGLGSTYDVSVDNGGTITPTSGTYGTNTAFRLQNGSADCVTTYTITITDATDPSCTITTTVMQDSCFVVTLSDLNDVCIDGSDMVFTATSVPGTLPGDSGVFTTTAGTGFMDNLDGTATLDVDVAGVGTYDVTYTYTDDNGCDAFQTVSVTINPEPVVTLNDPDDVCIDGSDMIFTATPVPGTLVGDSGVFTTTAGTGFMDNLDGTATLDVDIAGTGTYDVTYTYTDDNGCDAFQTVSVTINPEPVVTLNDPNDVCIDGSDMIFTATPVPGTLPGDSGVFTTTAGTGFMDNLDGTATLDVDVAGVGTYDVTYTYTDDMGCDAFQTVSVTINPEPVVTLNDPNDVCIDGSDMIFTATPVPGTLAGDSGVFTTTAGTGFTDHFDGTATLDVDVAGVGTYDVTYTYTDDMGCDAFQTVSVTINPEPVVTLNDPNDVCIDGSDMIFTATPVPGTLAGDSGVFTTTAGTGFTDNLDGTATLDVDVAGAGTYEVTYTYTDDMGCDAFQTVSVTINPEPVVTLNDPNDVCIDGSDMIFTATPVPGTLVGDSGVFTTTAGTGFMDNLDGTATLDVDVAGVGTYDVTYTYTDDMGCDAFQTVSVTINPEPVVTLNDPNDVCIDGSDMIFTATPVPGTLAGDSGVFTTTAGTGFMDNLDGTATLDVDVAGAGTYEVTYTYTDDMGCDAFQTVSVTINPEPVVTLNDPNDVCIDGSDMVFTATPVPGTLVGDSGVFTTTAGTGFTDHLDGTATLDVDVAGVGTYDVTYTYTDDNGCDAFQTVSVTINPEPVVTLNDPNDVCIDGSDMVFTATPVPGTLVGDSGVFTTTAGTGFTDHLDGTATLDVDVAGVGTYEVTYTYTDDNGCDAFQTVSVTINPEPVVTLNDPNDVCIDGSDMVFTATPVPGTLPGDRGVFTTTAGTGFMDNLDGTATLDVDVAGAGTYDVTYTYTDDNGCDAFQTVSVTINSIPEIDLEDQYVICLASDGTVYHPLTPTLLPNPPIDTGLSETEYNFQWYTGGEVIASNIIVGATQTSYSPTAAGDYTVLVTSIATSCSSAASTSVIESNPPENITIAVVYPAFSESNALLVSVSENGEYEYKLDDGFWQDSPRFDNVSGGEHIVYVRDIYYCNMISEIKLIITYPLFVTPNNDGYFDYWNVIGLDNQPDARIIIFDRYGKLLTVLSPLEVGWDGTYNGANMPSTDYWFTVEFVDPYDDARKIFRAHFALKR